MSHSGKALEAIFDRHWAIYRKVIDHDYMDHDDIASSLIEAMALSNQDGSIGRILDLGCGDAEISSRLVARYGCESFIGVDSSARALAEAASRDVWEGRNPEWIQADLLEFIKTTGDRYDLILAGFSVHHLSEDEKREFLSACHHCLGENGKLFFYDVFRLPGLTREESIARYLGWIHSNWGTITDEEYLLIEDHIVAADFPESADWFVKEATREGFRQCDIILQASHGFHSAFVMSTQAV